MTENTTPERAALLRREAANILGLHDFDPPGQWPEHFTANALAALMAGGYKNEHKAEYLKWQRRINGAIADGMEVERHETSHTTPARDVDTWGRTFAAGLPARVVATIPGKHIKETHYRIHRQPFAAQLHAAGLDPSEHVKAWMGAEWEDMEAPTVGAAKMAPPKLSAKDSRPCERQEYFRSLWLELGKPARNDAIWKTIKLRKGSAGCPVISTVGNETFTFLYSDKTTDSLSRHKFQTDMSIVRKA